MPLVLRIKRVFFEQIRAGTKTSEFRAATPFYSSRFDKNEHGEILFHYQTPERMLVELLRIDLIDNPFLERSIAYLSTPQIYELKLGRILDVKSS